MSKQSTKRRIVVVRHAQRADEAPLQHSGAVPWAKRRALYDPPLTRRGEDMARLTGSLIAAATAATAGDSSAGWTPPTESSSPPGSADAANAAHGAVASNPYMFRCVYTSPLLRCLQTASAIASTLGALPVEVDSALSSCARRVRNAEAAGESLAYAGDAEKALAAPGLEVRDVPLSDLSGSDVPSTEGDPDAAPGLPRFVDFVQRLAREAPGPGGLLVVTHREGIRELDRLAGEPQRKTPYCAAHEYEFDVEAGSWTLLHDENFGTEQLDAGSKGWVSRKLSNFKFAYATQTGEPRSYKRCGIM